MKKLTLAAAVAVALTAQVEASSHREAPFIGKYPQVDATDFYLFMSYEPGRSGYVTMIANYIPLQAAYGGPNYFPLDSNALYEIHIDSNGDAVEDRTFQFRFSDNLPPDGVIPLTIGDKSVTSVLRNIGPVSADASPGLNHSESFTLTLVDGPRRGGNAQSLTSTRDGSASFGKPFDYAGTKTFGGPGNYEGYARSFIHPVTIPGCEQPARVFVGQRYEAFKLALGEVFDLVNFVPVEGDSSPGAGDGNGFPGGITQDPARNALARNNVTSLALEVHRDCLAGDDGIVAAWTTASLPQATILNPAATFDTPEVGGGAWTQVSRLSTPLVNELVIGYDMKDRFNGSEPVNDGQFADFVTNPVLPAIIDTLFRDAVNSTLGASLATLAPTNLPRTDLVAAFLTGFAGVNQFEGGATAEMLRLNTTVAPTPRAEQQPLGVAAGDLAGFPNGRRPGDDTVDIALRVVMGALCHDLPLGDGGSGVNLGFCSPEDAAIGNVALTDGAPLSAADLDNRFPYLLTPYPGSPANAPLPTPTF
ncbi:MAG: DUF4331 domain-containing protein [Halioglobus sp.]|nr:DUF4331 domain-containing protein [Halioglobus sp.]